MADVELLIKLPEETVNAIKDNAMFLDGISSDIRWNITSAIVNGTPCEKHDEEVIKETVESIWGKPPYTELLDKIIAEIDELHLIGYATVDGKREIASRAVMQIIDKYKAESEEV